MDEKIPRRFLGYMQGIMEKNGKLRFIGTDACFYAGMAGAQKVWRQNDDSYDDWQVEVDSLCIATLVLINQPHTTQHAAAGNTGRTPEQMQRDAEMAEKLGAIAGSSAARGPRTCQMCKGSGHLNSRTAASGKSSAPCPSCKGSGQK